MSKGVCENKHSTTRFSALASVSMWFNDKNLFKSNNFLEYCYKVLSFHLIAWSPDSKNLIGKEWDTEIICLAELPALETWLAELPASQNQIGGTPNPPKPDWSNSQPEKAD
jgi:hypothetical protein